MEELISKLGVNIYLHIFQLLVNKKIISLDLPVKDVYKKVWSPEHGEVNSHSKRDMKTLQIVFENFIFLAAADLYLAEPGYSKTCVKRPLKNRQNKDLNDKW